MSKLTYGTAARIAARELRSSVGKFLFVVLSVAIGVAALTGVRGFSASFRSTLLTRARSIMAADLSARMFQQPTPDQRQALDSMERAGMRETSVTELLSMASSPRSMDPLLVSLKAVDPAFYPFYGSVTLAPTPGNAHPALPPLLTPSNVVVADDLLLRLHLAVGDTLKLGDRIFTIAGVVIDEPDRLSGSFAAGPRVLISRAGLESTGLLAPGSHASQRFLFALPLARDGSGSSDAEVAVYKERLERALPEAQVVDFRETNPALTQGLERATSLLSLMSLVALVLGAVGVAMAMRAHLAQRLDSVAVMKSLGATSGQILKIYLLQTLLLGLLGGILGVALGVAVQLAFPRLLARYININVGLHLQPLTVLTGLAVGLLTTLLFTLPPLLDIRSVRPILILRRSMEEDGSESGGLSGRVRRLFTEGKAQLLAALLILAGLSLIAGTLSDSVAVGGWFALGLLAVLVVLLLASMALLAGLRRLLERTRLSLPSVLRHGLANLYRPGNPSAALLAALGLGVMQIMTVFLMQQGVVRELHLSASPTLPNVFLIDITPEEVNGVRTLLSGQSAVAGTPELLPVVSSRILSIDGVPAAELKLRNFPRRMLQSISLTWAESPLPGTKPVRGRWWNAAEARDAAQHPLVAVNQPQADRLGVHIGSRITFSAQDAQFTATVAAITRSDGQHTFSRAEFVLPPAALAGLPAVWYGGVHADPERVGELQRALYKAFPTVTVINVAQALETVRLVVLQIMRVVQFLAAFSIFAGAVILASSIAGTRYRRVREVVVLKTLGGTRQRIAAIFSLEFAVLGLVAGAVGVIFANLLSRILLLRLSVAFQVQWAATFLALFATALLTVASGWIASYRILGQKPLEVLREE